MSIADRQFVVFPGVFSPAFFEDSRFFTSQVLAMVGSGERFLEVGPGIGACAILANLNGADVTAIEINPVAVENTLANAALHGVHERFRVVEGNVFSPLSSAEAFSTIYWNIPFAHVGAQVNTLSMLERAIFDPGYHTLKTFFREVDRHLLPGGRILVGFSSTLGHSEVLQEVAAQHGFVLRQLPDVGFDSDPGPLPEIRYELFEAPKPSLYTSHGTIYPSPPQEAC